MRIFSLVFLFLLNAYVSGQNYYFIKQENGNPPLASNGSVLNNQNDDADELNGGWTKVMASSTTQKLSSAILLPFPFQFQNTPVAALKIASSGFVTFDTSVLGTPPTGPELLPYVQMPPKSIVIWGLQINGENDKVLTRVFGTAPNRQFWVKYHSASTPGDSQGTHSYFSIVLEETSNRIYIVQMYQGKSVDLGVLPKINPGIQINSSSAIAVDNSITNTYANSQGKQPGDNVYYEFIYGTQPKYDLELKLVSAAPRVVNGGNFNLQYKVRNLGYMKVDSIELNFSFNGIGSSAKKNTVSLLPNGLNSVFDGMAAGPLTNVGQLYYIQAAIHKANDALEVHTANDTIKGFTVIANGTSASKKVMIELGTATWCGSCAIAELQLATIKTAYKDTVILVKHHTLDGMAGNGDSLNSQYLSDLPGAMVDRKDWNNTKSIALDSLMKRVQELKKDVVPANVTVDRVSLNSTTGSFTFRVTAKMTDYYYGNLSLGGVVLEDNVRGIGSAFNQSIDRKYTSDKNNPYYAFTSPIIGYYHNDVAWNIPKSIWGVPKNTIAQLYMPGDELVDSFEFKYPAILKKESIAQSPYLPVGSIFSLGKPADMGAAGFLVARENGKEYVMNSNKAMLWNNSLALEKPEMSAISVYPNPTSGVVKIALPVDDYQVSVTGLDGRVYLLEKAKLDYAEILSMDLRSLGLQNGMYILSLSTAQGQNNIKVLLQD